MLLKHQIRKQLQVISIILLTAILLPANICLAEDNEGSWSYKTDSKGILKYVWDPNGKKNSIKLPVKGEQIIYKWTLSADKNDNVALNPTVYLTKGTPAPWTGYLIEYKRLEKSVMAVQELNYIKQLYTLETSFLKEQSKVRELELKLELQKEQSERKYVEDSLTKQLAAEKIWYRQPIWIATFTVLGIVLIGAAASAVGGN